jgi:hypothetical protein
MNILNKATAELMYRIPYELLRVAFMDPNPSWRQTPVSIEDRIVSEVIRNRVMHDCNLVGGQTVLVSLDGLLPEYIDAYTMVYEIPPDRISYRNIISVLSVGYLPYNTAYSSVTNSMGTVYPNTMTDLMSAAQRVGDSASSVPLISNASVELIGANVVLIRDQQRMFTSSYQLRCVIANDEHMSNISPRAYLAFAKLCEHAVKSYIYNRLIVAIDQAYLTGGQELGQFKAIVETYSDQEEMYQTYLNEKWRKIAYMATPHDHTRLIRMQISPGL